ncbi:MAG TPA: MFS transporter [Methylomirabilota bacterium]|nr:MFS transporter [Methylomirabilota bacterium]
MTEPEDPRPDPVWGEPAGRVVPPEVFDRPEGTAEGRLAPVLAPLLPLYGLGVLTAFNVGMLPPLLPLVAGEWALSTVEAGLINTVYAVGRLGGSYPASWTRARWGTRTAVFLGLVGLIVGSVACGLAPSFRVFLAARLLMGLGASAAFLAVFAEFLEAAPAAWRGRLTNAFEAVAILSMAAGSVLAAELAHAAGWRVVFVGAGLAVMAGFLAGRSVEPWAGRHVAPSAGVLRIPAAELRRLAPVYAAGLALAMTWTGLVATLIPLLGHARYGLSAPALGLALGAGYVAELAGLIGVGLVIDRFRREPVFLTGAASVVAGGGLLAVGTRPELFVIGLVLVGGGFAVWMIPALVLADRVGTPLPAGHLALYRIAMDAGMILGPLVLGGIAQLAGDRLAVGTAGLVLVGGALILMRRGRPPVI